MFPDFYKLIILLNKHKIDYVVIGGYAVNLYGYLRMTEDIDILFRKNKQNGEKLLQVLKEYGLDIEELSGQDFSESLHLRLGEVPNSIDLINDTVGLDLDEVFKNFKEFKVNEIKLKVINLEDLIGNKRALNTYKDLADVEELIKIMKKR
jgi:hypothetical protein